MSDAIDPSKFPCAGAAIGAGGEGAGGVPRLVIRGESNEADDLPWLNVDGATGEKFILIPDGQSGWSRISLPEAAVGPYTAITDWLNCSFLYAHVPGDHPNVVLRDVLSILPAQFKPLRDLHKGLHGYQQSFEFGETSAKFAFGGQSGTGFISIPGAACQCIEDWTLVRDILKALPRARITRWDGAVDDYLGQHSVDDAVAMWSAGAFGTGGNQPKPNQHGNWLKPHGAGRTLEIRSADERQDAADLRERDAARRALASLGAMGTRVAQHRPGHSLGSLDEPRRLFRRRLPQGDEMGRAADVPHRDHSPGVEYELRKPDRKRDLELRAALQRGP